jgi:hypothetical protein
MSSAPDVGVSVLTGRLLLSGKEAAVSPAVLEAHSVQHVLSVTTEPLQSPEVEQSLQGGITFSHVSASGATSTMMALNALLAANDAIETALQSHPNGHVLVHCSRGPQRGGASVAVGAAHLMKSSGLALCDALTRCAAHPRGLLLSALYALELRLHGSPSDLPASLSTYWELPPDDASLPGAELPQPPLSAASVAPRTGTDLSSESVAVARGAAMRVRCVSRDPQIAAVSGLVSAAEAEELLAIGRTRLAPSLVARTARSQEASGEAEAWRTSSSCSLWGSVLRPQGHGGRGTSGDDADLQQQQQQQQRQQRQPASAMEDEEYEEYEEPVYTAVLERAAYLCGLSPDHAEDLQLVHYSPSQQYREHTDYFSPTQDASHAERCASGGNRLVTVFCCLAAADVGGTTDFPQLGLSFALGVGEALVWMNIDKSGMLDGRTLHAGRPVEVGEKAGLNIWLRQRLRTEPAPSLSDVQGSGRGTRGTAWRPLRPPPRQTHASPAAQNAIAQRERLS